MGGAPGRGAGVGGGQGRGTPRHPQQRQSVGAPMGEGDDDVGMGEWEGGDGGRMFSRHVTARWALCI